jgi:hypothetical protein
MEKTFCVFVAIKSSQENIRILFNDTRPKSYQFFSMNFCVLILLIFKKLLLDQLLLLFSLLFDELICLLVINLSSLDSLRVVALTFLLLDLKWFHNF